MLDPMDQLRREHTSREAGRMKMRAPITVVTVLVIGVGVAVGLHQARMGNPVLGIILGVLIGLVGVLWSMAAQLLAEWDRGVVLRLGRFSRVAGPGFFMVIPIIETITRVVDMRIRTTPFYSESILTKDTVPVRVDAIAFWHVWDSQKAVLEVESYYQAISMTIQTAMRDIVGVHMLAEILAERERIGHRLQEILQAKAQAWGIAVNSIEIRDIMIPDELRDALSRQAQAERERQARTILGQAEMEIAEKFAEASKGYVDNPVALQLRAMNIVYEGLRNGGSLMLLPSTVLDTMNLGSMAALGLVQAAQGKLGKPPTGTPPPPAAGV